MSKKKNIPEIRFKGFDDEWEEKILIEILDIIDGDRGVNYPNGNDFQGTGHTLFLSASNVTTNGFIFNHNQYITKEKSNSLGNGKLITNDIILTSRGSIGHIALYSQIIQQQIPFVRINSGMLILRPKSFIKPCFIEQVLKSPLGKKQIDLISFGSAQPQLTKKDVSKYIIVLPVDKPEQSRIGSYFQHLDNLINLKQNKYDKLAALKKAMLVKMFPKDGADVPDIRFKGFTGKWEEKKLGDIAEFSRGKGLSRDTIVHNGNYKCVLYGHLYTTYGMVINDVIYSTNEYIKDMLISQFGDVLIPCSDTTPTGLARATSIERDGIVLGGDINVIRPLKNINGSFLSYNINSNRSKLLPLIKGTTVRHLDNSELKTVELFIANDILEQEQIVNYFKNLDTLITLHQKELDKLKNIKKACLEKMFV